MGLFAVTTARGPAWDPARDIRDQDGWTEHAAFADRLVAAGVVVLGGPIGAGDAEGDADDVALLAMELPDAGAAHRTFAADPWVVSGVLRLRCVRPWTVWLDGT